MAGRAKRSARMSDDDKRAIYDVLKRNFSFDEEYPLANLGWCFQRENIDKAEYGFLKLTTMLEEMGDFVSLYAREVGGVPQSMFTLRECERFEKDIKQQKTRISKKDSNNQTETNEADGSVSGRKRVLRAKKSADKERNEEEKNIASDEKELSSEKDTKSDAHAAGSVSDDADMAKASGAGRRGRARASAAKEGAELAKGGASFASKKGTSSGEADGSKNDSASPSSQGAEAKAEVAAKPRKSAAAKSSAASAEQLPPAKKESASEERPASTAKRPAAAKKANAAAGESGASAGKSTSARKEGASAEKKRATSAKKSALPSSGDPSASAPSAGAPASPNADDGDGAADASSGARQASPSPRPTRGRMRTIPGKALERFASLGSWPEFLSALAAMALEEPWDFNDLLDAPAASGMSVGALSGLGAMPSASAAEASTGARSRKDILHNYIRYTFYRLTLEDKVGYSDAEDFAAFNTGLVDNHYEDIYACFEPATDPDARRPWTFSGFSTAGSGRLGKRLVRELNPLPQPASYLRRKEDLLFDLDREVVCDIHHIVVDNVHRLPLNFLRDELASSQECLGILAGMEELAESSRRERFERLRATIDGDARLFNRLSTSINAAIDVARRQVRWNYKTAVPAYYPRTNSMNLLLPLNLTSDTSPDVALVVELQKSGNYQGQTIVTMAQAYCDARLLCRPYIDWLSPASISAAAGDEEYDEE